MCDTYQIQLPFLHPTCDILLTSTSPKVTSRGGVCVCCKVTCPNPLLLSKGKVAPSLDLQSSTALKFCSGFSERRNPRGRECKMMDSDEVLRKATLFCCKLRHSPALMTSMKNCPCRDLHSHSHRSADPSGSADRAKQ